METLPATVPARMDAATRTEHSEMLVDVSTAHTADVDHRRFIHLEPLDDEPETSLIELARLLEPPGFNPWDVMDVDIDIPAEDVVLLVLEEDEVQNVLATPQPRGV